MGETCDLHWRGEKYMQMFGGKSLFGRPKHRLEDDDKHIVKE
jgi:hypothetical protein